MSHIDRSQDCNRLSTLPLWQAVTVSVGLVLLALPLMVLPGLIAAQLRGVVPGSVSTVTAAIGIVLCLGAFRALAPILGVAPSDVFVRWPGRSFPRWATVGVLLPGAIVLGATVVGGGVLDGRPVEPWAAASVVAGAVLLATWPAVLEEFLVRGYLLAVIGYRWNWYAAVGVTASVFALLHQGHATDPWSLAWYLATAGVAGVLFALVTLSTGNAWNAVALHAAWNTVFGGDVLAFRPPADGGAGALVTIELHGAHPLLGGEALGVSASPLATIVLLLAVGLLLVPDRGWFGR